MPFIIDKFKSKNGASVSEEFALFNWSSVGYIWPDLNEIMRFMCQLAALLSELLMLYDSIDWKVIFLMLFICCLLRASAAYFNAMYVIVFLLFSAVLP